MLTKATYKYFRSLVKLSSFLRASPFTLDPTVNAIAVAKSKAFRLHYAINLLRHLVYSIYLTQLVIQGIIEKQRSVTKQVIDAFYVTTMIPLFMFQLSTLLNSHEFVVYFRSVFFLDQLLTAKYRSDKLQSRSDGVDFLIAMMNTVVIPQAMILTVLWMENPEDPRYMFHYLPVGVKVCWMYILWWFTEVYFIVVPCVNLFFVWHGMNMCGAVANFWMKNFTAKIKKSGVQKVGPSLTLPKEMMDGIRAYKCIHVRTQQANFCYRKMVWSALNLYATSNQVLIIFVVVRLHDKIPTPVFVVFPFYLFLFLVFEFLTYPMVAGVHVSSAQFQYALATSGSNVCRRYARSCGKLGIYCGHLYVINKQTVLTFILLISNATVSLLVTIH